ncbi:MAG TPA: hypothetical protein VGM29_11605 [Polyangiaceae bacterium]
MRAKRVPFQGLRYNRDLFRVAVWVTLGVTLAFGPPGRELSNPRAIW